MNPQIAALHDLQVHDRRMVALENRLKAIPKRLEEMDRDLEHLEGMVSQERGKLGDTITFRDEQRRRLEDEEEHIKNSKTRLGTVKTTRELNAAQREIDTTRRLANTRAQEIANITEALDEAQARVDKMQGGLDKLRAEFDTERERLNGEKNQLEARIGNDAGARQELSDKIDLRLRRTYERIRKRAGGVAYVAVRERRCAACRMNVPHASYVELRKGTEIKGCESCGRLLYWQGHFPEEAARAEAKVRKAQQDDIEAKLSESA
jgi:predicted  nucleic acid-binding Zn-ribbon protein